MLIPGLYEQVVNKSLEQEMSEDKAVKCVTEQIDKAEAPSVLAKYIAEIIEKGLRQVSGEDMSGQLDLANRIVSAVAETTGDEEFDGMTVAQRAEQLMAVAQKQNSITALTDEVTIPQPETSLAASSLFTGSIHEPSMMDELRKKIIRLADWDTMKTNRYANRAIAYLLNRENEKLPKETIVAFEP